MIAPPVLEVTNDDLAEIARGITDGFTVGMISREDGASISWAIDIEIFDYNLHHDPNSSRGARRPLRSS